MDKAQKILVVDDEPVIRDMMVDFIKSALENVEVIKACDGFEGLAFAKLHRPDLILTDVQMPGVDGWDLLNQVKEAKLQTRVIMVTGVYTGLRDTVEFIRNGACDVVHKPFRLEALILAIKRALALVSPLSLYSTDPSNILEEAIRENTHLQSVIEFQQRELKELKAQVRRETLVLRALNLGLSVIVTVWFYRLGMVQRGMQVYLLALLLFLLLSLPFDRIKMLIGKAKKMEARAEFSAPGLQDTAKDTPTKGGGARKRKT